MEAAKVKATPREQFGKGPSRRLRSSGTIPAVLYGQGMKTTALAVSPKELSDALATELGPNRVLEIEIEGQGSHRALLAEHQYHPVSRSLIHVDFQKIDEGKRVNMRVPLRLVGKAKGTVVGGVLEQVFRTLPVRCLPSDVPAAIECDVTALEIEQTVAVRDLRLPQGVTVTLPPAQTIGGVFGKKQVAEEETEAPAAEAAAAPAAPEAKKAEKK
jgi:large subunit ribosomal protein L25